MTADRTPQAARLTPAGRGAIAVIEVSDAAADWNDGEPALFRPANQRPWSDQPVGRLLYGQWGLEPAEDVVVCRTDESSFEIHCHGGDAAVTRILGDLGQRGIATVSAEVPSRRRGTVLESELRTALSQALTARTADMINEQIHLVTTDGVPCLQLWASMCLPCEEGEIHACPELQAWHPALARRTDPAPSEREHVGERTAPSPYPSPPKTGA
ncbi:MAG: hypothetical protein SH850_06085, partial [Planctomycetaceae bacterium]|nr:hypothetical protein [Planctomycetaceae bacterium]